jgi:AP-1 complex subunit beta-1
MSADPSTKADATPTSGGAALDLLDLDGGDDMLSGPAPVVVQKMIVLPPTQPGQGGNTGFGIAAAIARQSGSIQLMLTLTNSSQVPIGGFAVQVNKNPFGLGPAAQLVCPDLAPGQSHEAVITMTPGALFSNTAPTNPLFLQIALKNSLDIFYFNVPFDLPAVFVENGGVNKDSFTQVWQKVSDQRQSVRTGIADRSLTADSIKASLALDNVTYVAQRQKDDNTMFVYVSATTTNNIVLLAEVSISRASNSVELKIRTETASLMPIFEAAVCKRLGIQ